MTKTEDFQTVTYDYTGISEMMSHIGTMGASGWTLIYSSHVALKATYKKDLS